ncbi:hypothetical protein ERX37_02720 [Macrococcus hajekii]|uniref:Rhodanese domain-containing protein n=1 Tax=Macrococcus hajekii TaxID=198482 RepID=A0A4V3BED1_9STAP|nr:rhodanese-like domain-containing protein [Macrococcus hajekii]TDM03015.1 hypothetical protein ERX37_02720 [Macrococcus hajekii]GGB05868.1 thiosulfate sulfurtransferase [Macrococcus hajekii]
MQVWIDEEELDYSKHQLFDCRNVMDDIEASLALYNKHHIEHAIFVPGYPVLYEHNKPEEGRHPLPNLALFKSFIEKYSQHTIPVAYDTDKGFMATRFFFLCDILGIPCLIMKQSYDKMTIAKSPGDMTMKDIEQLEALRSIEEPHINHGLIASRDEVRNTTATLIDARANKRFLGEEEPIDVQPGRIPGAVNFPYEKVFDNQLPDTEEAIVYCGSGLSATSVYTALRAAGKKVKLYPGSYSEWIFHHPEEIERG